jgi:hypothetical protein
MKIRRNALCPCDRGRKYKHCCGALSGAASQLPSIYDSGLPPELIAQIVETKAKIDRRKAWPYVYGAIPPPVTHLTEEGVRLASAGGRIYQSQTDTTWHGFLYNHLQDILGTYWFAEEAYKPDGERHILVEWYKSICERELGNDYQFNRGNAETETGTTLAFRSVAYDLWCMAQACNVSEPLLERLRHPDQFEGARYELWVAACFLRAGFKIDFEDETDRRKRHCEFVATHKETGMKYSVEAKRRHRSIDHEEAFRDSSYIKLDITQLIANALSKTAEHQRIIFIDVNMPPNHGSIAEAPWLYQFKASKEVLERQPKFRDRVDLKAFLMATDYPYHYVASTKPDPRNHFLITFFNQPELYGNGSILEKEHPVVLRLTLSISRHFSIPEDFY